MDQLSEMCNKSKSAEAPCKKWKKAKRKSHLWHGDNSSSSKEVPLTTAPLLKRGESASFYYSHKDTKNRKLMLIKGESHDVDDDKSPFN